MRPRVAVSACLLGEPVRYDGKIKGIPWVSEVLPLEVEVVSICPEVGAGMPVPRPPIQIVRRYGNALQLVVVDEGSDHTLAMQHFIRNQLAALEDLPVDGYVFKARSPSCGLRDAPHFASAQKSETPILHGAGLWAAALIERFADLPCVDESEVQTPAGQHDFLARVRKHWQSRL